MEDGDLIAQSVFPRRAAGLTPSRRSVLAAPFVLTACARPTPLTIGFASTGGAFNDILRRVWIDDFEKRTGIRVNLSSNTSLTQTELQVATDRPQWDVVELTGPWYVLAVKRGLLLPLDTDIVDRKAMPAECFRPYGVEYAMFNNCIGWDRRVVPDRLQPAGWADFWDTASRPGRRSMDAVSAGGGTIEMALMADGVAPDRLYPLDLDRAFRSLDRLGRDNILWSQSFAQPIERLMSQEVSMASTWPFRVMSANKGGANLGFTCNQCSVAGDWLGVVRTSRNPEAAFRLINALISDTKACAEFSRLTHYGTPNLDSLKLIPREDAELVPTSPALAGKLYRPDDDWWAENLVPVAQRFKRWQLGLAA
jgi:putative spermidine/putrescine transport system substrate-binding protein